MHEYKRVFIAVDDKHEADASRYAVQIDLWEQEGWQFVAGVFRPKPPSSGGHVILTFKRAVEEE